VQELAARDYFSHVTGLAAHAQHDHVPQLLGRHFASSSDYFAAHQGSDLFDIVGIRVIAVWRNLAPKDLAITASPCTPRKVRFSDESSTVWGVFEVTISIGRVAGVVPMLRRCCAAT